MQLFQDSEPKDNRNTNKVVQIKKGPEPLLNIVCNQISIYSYRISTIVGTIHNFHRRSSTHYQQCIGSASS